MSGFLLWNYKDKQFQIYPPSSEHKYYAEIIYDEEYELAIKDGAFNEDELLDYLVSNGFWSLKEEERVSALTNDVERLKVEMYNAYFKSNTIKTLKMVLKDTKEGLEELYYKKHSWDHLSAHYLAEQARQKYLFGCGLFLNKEKVFNTAVLDHDDSYLLDDLIMHVSKNIIKENEYREMARTDPWRTYWISRKAASCIFTEKSIDMSDEQRTLIVWSNLYDNIQEHPDCPNEDVVSDDDLLDGWLILQSRKRKKESDENKINKLTSNPKIASGTEIFIPAETPEDAKRINAMNTAHSRMIKKQRQHTIEKHGIVNEVMLPDFQQELQMEAAKKFSEAVRSTK